MLNNLSDTEQEEAELRYLFGEAMSEYLQGYAYEQGPPAFDTLETASLNLGDDIPRQRFDNGGTVGDPAYSGGLPGLSDTNMSDITGIDNNVGTIESITGINPIGQSMIGLAFNAATKSNPASIALSGVNVAVTALTGKSITDHLGLTDPRGYFGPLGFPGTMVDPVTGQETTQSGRHATHNTPDLTFAPPAPPGFMGTGENKSTIGIDVQEAPMTGPQAAEASDPASDAAAAAASAAGQGVASGGSSPAGEVDSPESGAGIGASQGSTAGQTGTGATGVASEGGFGGGPGGSSGNSGDSSGEGSSGTGEGSAGDSARKEGGQIKGYREGDLVETDQADTQLDGLGLGPLGIINDPDGTTGIADDLDMDLPVGSFVLNKEAVKLAGVVSINKMIKEAIDLAIEDGVDLPAEIKTAEKIPIKISKGEGAIPATIVGYIGEKKLENLNNRGLKVMKQKESEEAPVEMAAAPSPQEDLLAQIQSVA